MYTSLLQVHNILRWVILLAALITLAKYFMGWFSQQNWRRSDNVFGIVFTSLIDLQLLVGFLLYFVYSPITEAAFQDFGAAMQNSDLRFYAVEHSLIMLIAVALVHIGRVRTKKVETSKAKFRNGLIFFGLAYLVIMLGIPWGRVI